MASRRCSIVEPIAATLWMLVLARTLRATTAANNASLPAKSRVDSRLSGARDLRDLLDARALEASLEKHLSRCVKDSLLNLSGKLAAWPAAPDHAAVGGKRFCRPISVHMRLFTSP